MKRFIDSEGQFEIKIPDHWRYSLKNKKVHTYQDNEIELYDTFQVSINDVRDQAKKTNFIKLTKTLTSSVPTQYRA